MGDMQAIGQRGRTVSMPSIANFTGGGGGGGGWGTSGSPGGVSRQKVRGDRMPRPHPGPRSGCGRTPPQKSGGGSIRPRKGSDNHAAEESREHTPRRGGGGGGGGGGGKMVAADRVFDQSRVEVDRLGGVALDLRLLERREAWLSSKSPQWLGLGPGRAGPLALFLQSA